MVLCQVCEREFKSLKSLAHHIVQSHRSEYRPLTKEYYDKFLKKDERDGICKIEGCNNKTTFVNLVDGYSKYCSHKCYNLDLDIIKIRIESNKNRIFTEETIEKMRISAKKNWEDPNYTMRQPEVQQRKREKMIKLTSLFGVKGENYGLMEAYKPGIPQLENYQNHSKLLN